MKKILYFDAFSGLSGDMIISSLISLANIDEKWLKPILKHIALTDYQINIKKDTLSSIEGISFKVIEKKKQNKARNLNDIENIIKRSSLNNYIKINAISIFNILAEAEATIHGKSKYEIHFHEVGAIDAIVDIVTASILIDHLKVNDIYSSPLPFGKGFVQCQHGMLPLPAPASLEILKDYPIYGTDIKGELVTPTGAAIIKHFSKGGINYPEMTVERIGYGIGSRKRENPPNILRTVMGISSHTNTQKDNLILLETNIDDINPEIIPYVSDKLFKAGALDVFTCPITMKKSRNGIKLSVLIKNDINYNSIMSIIFTETTSIGVRKNYIQREELQRKNLTIETKKFGKMNFKESRFKGKIVQVKPDFECLSKIAKDTGIPLKDLYKEFIIEYEKSK